MSEYIKISPEIRALGREAEREIRPYFERLEEICDRNTEKVLAAFAKNRVSDNLFAGTTGYGYDDYGRDTLDKIYADIFGTEAALVRIGFVNGTHALSCAMFSAVKTGDTVLSVTGPAYDTLQNTITGDYCGSMKSYGIGYRQVDLKNGEPDLPAIKVAAADENIKLVFIQRSRGYGVRKTLSVEEIGEICKTVREVNTTAAIMVDNCYGEFTEEIEPTQVGADIIAGSLIKNPGGGLAPTGGYIAGRADLVENASYKLTAPGIGGECGCTMGQNRLLYQGALPIVDDEAFADALFATFGCLKEQRAEAADDRGKASQPYRGEEALLAALQAEPLGMEALRQLAEDHAPAGDTFTWLMIWLAEAQRDGLIAQYPDGRYGPHPALRTAV